MTTSSPVVVLLSGILLAAACGGDEERATAGASGLPQGSEPFAIDPESFTAEIHNRYWPMTPGTRWKYREVEADGTEREVVVTATSRTRRLANGVVALVVRDTVTERGELVEDTFDWYAEDGAGNVWYLGEETAEFDGGELTTTAGSWEAGVDGALAGVIVPGRPVDDLRYRQEHYAGEAEDNGEVLGVEEQVDVPAGHFARALLTKDTNALEPEVLELKFYAPDVGPVLALGVSGGGGREELVERGRIGARAARLAGTTPLGDTYP